MQMRAFALAGAAVVTTGLVSFSDGFGTASLLPRPRDGRLVAAAVSRSPERDSPPPASNPRRRELDFFLRQAVDGTDADRTTAAVQRLQDFGSRHATDDSCGAAAGWIATELAACGVDSVSWDAGGRGVAEGVNFARLESGDNVHAARILLRRP